MRQVRTGDDRQHPHGPRLLSRVLAESGSETVIRPEKTVAAAHYEYNPATKVAEFVESCVYAVFRKPDGIEYWARIGVKR